MALLRGRGRIRIDDSDFGLALATAPAVAFAFRLYVPEWSAVRLAGQDHDMTAQNVEDRLAAMRAGYVPATGLGLLIGTATSILSQSWLPVGLSILALAGLITVQEAAAPHGLRLNPARALGAGFAALLAEAEFDRAMTGADDATALPTAAPPAPAPTGGI